MKKTIFIMLLLLSSTFTAFGQWQRIDVNVRTCPIEASRQRLHEEDLQRQRQQEQRRREQEQWREQSHQREMEANRRLADQERQILLQQRERAERQWQQQQREEKEQGRQDVRMLQEFYSTLESHPERISDGWYDALETNNDNYVGNARVQVSNNQIIRYISYYKGGTERRVIRPATINKSKAMVQLEQTSTSGSITFTNSFLHIYFLN
jgi:TolA-binding protein